jgi:hypothetical protein
MRPPTEQQRAAARHDAVALVAAQIRGDTEGCRVIIAHAHKEALAMTLALVVRVVLAETGMDLEQWAIEAPVQLAARSGQP